jgi:hypothetical protein
VLVAQRFTIKNSCIIQSALESYRLIPSVDKSSMGGFTLIGTTLDHRKCLIFGLL